MYPKKMFRLDLLLDLSLHTEPNVDPELDLALYVDLWYLPLTLDLKGDQQGLFYAQKRLKTLSFVHNSFSCPRIPAIQ